MEEIEAGDTHRNLFDSWMRNDFRGQRGRTLNGHGHEIDNARGKASLRSI